MSDSSLTLSEDIHLIGISLPEKTSNANGQSTVEIGNLWQQFEKEQFFMKIPNKISQELYAVYHDYEGDHTQPFAYFIGAAVVAGTDVPEGLSALTIPQGTYYKHTAKGPMPACIGMAWQEIWASDLDRAFDMDFEVYGAKSQNWADAEVDIFLS